MKNHPASVHRFYTRPFLTEEHFKAAHAHRALTTYGGGVSGLCVPDAPWGEQCTRYLEDGTPVCMTSFAIAVLAHLAGDPDAMRNHLEQWDKRVREVCDDAERRGRRAA